MGGRPTHYEVLLTQGAEQDLESIHDYSPSSTARLTPTTFWTA